MVPTPVRTRALPEAQLCRCTSCSHLVLVPRDRCGTPGGERGGAYYGRFFRDSEQRAAGVLVDRSEVDGVYYYLFALPAHARPELPAFEVPLAEAPAVQLRCVGAWRWDAIEIKVVVCVMEIKQIKIPL